MDLSEKHACILLSLLEHGKRPISDFATIIQTSKATITDLVDRLDKLELTHRVDLKKDRRKKIVALLPKGRSLAKIL